MNPKWAEENLQTIRTLMERSALYRRALAPVMILCGVIGIAGGIFGANTGLHSPREFIAFWAGDAVLALTGAILLMRRQAIKEGEPFWSLPTKRVATALLPAFLTGAAAGAALAVWSTSFKSQFLLVVIWCFCFGCGIHAAGFFMPRGIRLFGWLFILSGCALLGSMFQPYNPGMIYRSENYLMASIFGGLHLAYGIYLYFTEKKNPAA